MPFKVVSKVKGLAGALGALRGIDNKVRKKILRKAIAAAGQVVLKEARKGVPVDTGLLKKSLGKKVKFYPNGIALAIVGPRTGFRKEVTRKGKKQIANPTKYAHLAEKARPFLNPAVANRQWVKVLNDTVAAELAKL